MCLIAGPGSSWAVSMEPEALAGRDPDRQPLDGPVSHTRRCHT